jgi:hypothetical protein
MHQSACPTACTAIFGVNEQFTQVYGEFVGSGLQSSTRMSGSHLGTSLHGEVGMKWASLCLCLIALLNIPDVSGRVFVTRSD